MTQIQKDRVFRKMQAMADSDAPLINSITKHSENILAVHVQPWGPPMYLSYEQAEKFTQGLPSYEAPKKPIKREVAHAHIRRKAG